MLFSSVTFLYGFLPLTLALYFITPMRKGSCSLRNVLLLAASLVFYAWGEPRYVLLMLVQCVAAYLFGLGIEKWRGKRAGEIMFALSCCVSLGALLFFKYTDFVLINLRLSPMRLALPVGISFYTFQVLSYTIDLRRGNIKAQRNFITLAAYITLFPQLVAGPIVRYTMVAQELTLRNHSTEDFARGVERFMIGMGKKVLLANVLGQLVDLIRGQPGALAAWTYLLAYTLHIYFDFSGYSDMAIGMGRMLGLHFPENFNYPYTTRSVAEFWRRWHMTLGSWFRDYVYIPMGGNRVRPLRYCLNIMVVWGLTGFWHGANWNFMLWGLYYGLLLLFEKFALRGRQERWPKALQHTYGLIMVGLGFVLFDCVSLSGAGKTYLALFGFAGGVNREALYYLRSYALPLLIGIVGATPVPARLAKKCRDSAPRAFTAFTLFGIAILLALVTAGLVDGSFNPFIYFRF
ncbi:MAG: MBOAT family protein [Oscillospiraceae bacterium]|nr:MBOAT family protein [Oscillospiraceae bacterium]